MLEVNNYVTGAFLRIERTHLNKIWTIIAELYRKEVFNKILYNRIHKQEFFSYIASVLSGFLIETSYNESFFCSFNM